MEKETTREEEILEFISTIKEMIERNDNDNYVMSKIETKYFNSIDVHLSYTSLNRSLNELINKYRLQLAEIRGE